jgi:type IV fimbrial biogenesis protein FimT
MHNQPLRQAGITLAEILITLLLASIVASFAMPSYKQLMSANRARAASYALVNSLTLARNEAVKRNANVDVAPAAGGWQSGWTVQSGAQVLEEQRDQSKVSVAGPAAAVTFDAYGRVAGAPLRFVVSADSGLTRCVTIDMGGRPSLLPKEGRNGDCGI